MSLPPLTPSCPLDPRRHRRRHGFLRAEEPRHQPLPPLHPPSPPLPLPPRPLLVPPRPPPRRRPLVLLLLRSAKPYPATPAIPLRRPAPTLEAPKPPLYPPLPFGARRNFSTSSPPPEPDGVIDAVARLISDAASSAASSVPSPFTEEVSAAAADSFLPVAAVQHLIDAVHSVTGLNWWASIALATLLVRTATIPLLVRQIKAGNRLSALRPEIIAFLKEGDSGDPQSTQESRKKFFELLKMHDVSPLTPFKRLFIQGPIILSFFYAIRNMIEKVPSLKGGGAYWFTDLTTPDELYILPVLTSMTVAADELNLKAQIQGNPISGQRMVKNFKRALAVLIIPLSMSSCKAHFFWWVPWTMFTFAYRLAFRTPAVVHFFGLPHPVPQPAPTPVQVPAPTSPNLSEGTESMPSPTSANLSEWMDPMAAVDSLPAATSSSEPSDVTEEEANTEGDN